MGIKFACAECGYVLHVKSALAGKRGFCPKCQAKVDIPAEGPPTASQIAGAVAYDTPESVNMAMEPQMPTAAATILPMNHTAPANPTGSRPPMAVPVSMVNQPLADPIAENPEMQWYVVPPGAATPYGPAAGKLFRSWIEEGRVTADSLVWRQDWKDWQPASSVLPQFRTPPMPQGLPPLPGGAKTPLADIVPDLSLPTAIVTAAAPAEPVDEQLAELTKPRRVVKKPRDFTNVLIIVFAIGVLVMVPVMIYVLK
jgi:hypothetical protein